MPSDWHGPASIPDVGSGSCTQRRQPAEQQTSRTAAKGGKRTLPSVCLVDLFGQPQADGPASPAVSFNRPLSPNPNVTRARCLFKQIHRALPFAPEIEVGAVARFLCCSSDRLAPRPSAVRSGGPVQPHPTIRSFKLGFGFSNFRMRQPVGRVVPLRAEYQDVLLGCFGWHTPRLSENGRSATGRERTVA